MTSFESRSGIRGFYGDDSKGDEYIFQIALEQEARYQQYKLGERVGNSGSPTPLPPNKRTRSQWTPDPAEKSQVIQPTAVNGLVTPAGTPLPVAEVVTLGGQTKPTKATRMAARKVFMEDYLGVAEKTWDELTDELQAKLLRSFDNFMKGE